jgi:hypothetical protein
VKNIPIFSTIETLPPRTGLLWLVDVGAYKDQRAGFHFQYRYLENNSRAPAGEPNGIEAIADRLSGPKPNLRLLKADTYLYNAGLSAVPADLMSDDMIAIFHQAMADIVATAEQGRYQQFEVMTAGPLNVPPEAAEPAWVWAAMRYRPVKGPGNDDDQDRVSHLAVRTDGGYINKVRYTYPAALPPSLAYSSFLLFLFEWRHSIERVLAGKSPVPPSGDFNDPKWLRAVTELRTVPLPHPLGFFDRTAAEARQAELLAGHLHGPERPFDKFELREALVHEAAHALFSDLEREMALEIGMGGFGGFADGRTPPKT